MLLAVLRPPPPSRVIRASPAPPRALFLGGLRRPEAPRLRLTPPTRVAAPPRPARRLPLAPVPPLSYPVLRLPGPSVSRPVRLSLRAPVPTPLDVVPTAMASTVGILATGGTRIIMVPADLTRSGRVDITQFRLSLVAGVW